MQWCLAYIKKQAHKISRFVPMIISLTCDVESGEDLNGNLSFVILCVLVGGSVINAKMQKDVIALKKDSFS